MDIKPKRRVGRRLLLTPQLQAKICKFIADGATDHRAARASGVSRDTFYDWLERGRGLGTRRKGQIFVQFVHAVEEARAHAIVAAEIQVKKQDPKWYLTHRAPEEWASIEEILVRRKEVGLTDDAASAILASLLPHHQNGDKYQQ